MHAVQNAGNYSIAACEVLWNCMVNVHKPSRYVFFGTLVVVLFIIVRTGYVFFGTLVLLCCIYYGISVCTVTAYVFVVLCFWCLFTVCGWKVGPWVWVSQQVKEIAVSVIVKLVFVVQALAIAGSEGVTIVTERSYGWGDFPTWKKWFEGSEHCSKSPSTWGHARCIVKQGGFETIVLLKGLTATLFRHGVW